MKWSLAGICILLPLLGASPALAQLDSREALALRNQMLELRHEVEVLRSQVAGGSGGGYTPRPAPSPGQSGDITAQLLDRVMRLEDEVRTLHGQIDEANNALQQQTALLSKQIGDIDFKLGIDTGAGTPPPGGAPGAAAGPGPTPLSPTPLGPRPLTGPPSGPPPGGPQFGGSPQAVMSPPPAMLGAPVPPQPVQPPAAPVRRTPELAIQEGNAALARRDYAGAEAAAREVLAGPRTPRSLDAQFLLAQALTGRRNWQAAAVAYDDSYSRARTGPHAQDSLVGLASALTSLNESRAACATLDKLKAEFPNTRGDLREPVASVRQRAGCR